MKRWTISDIPDLTGKTAIVTGGNAGLGFVSALELARKGAEVVIACRRSDAGADAIARIRSKVPEAKVSCVPLDLTDQNSITTFADTYKSGHDRLDILLNNAGVVSLETLRHTSEGHEMHMATNHYGTFVLTGHLFELLCQTPGARVVTVTSGGARYGEIDFDDMDWREREYAPVKAYGASKLANLLFMYALQSRFDAAGADALSVSAHPGLAATERQQSKSGLLGLLMKWMASSIETGVAPQLRAATDPNVSKRDFYGPRFGVRGPAWNLPVKPELDKELAEKLWRYTEELTGIRFNGAKAEKGVVAQFRE